MIDEIRYPESTKKIVYANKSARAEIGKGMEEDHGHNGQGPHPIDVGTVLECRRRLNATAIASAKFYS
jgi:hypothetical protein